MPFGGAEGLKTKEIVKSGRICVVAVLVCAPDTFVETLCPGRTVCVTFVSLPPWLWVVEDEGDAIVCYPSYLTSVSELRP